MATKIKIAFMGFRHGHIVSLYKLCQERNDVEIVAACEEHEPTFQHIKAQGNIALTHNSYITMLEDVEIDVVAVGDAYGRRGNIIVEDLKRGKHVISDKPICTSLKECDEIIHLARTKNLKVGCQLDMRFSGAIVTMKELIRKGEIGEICAISFGGQHPLLYGSRAEWYFEKGMHGGTLNDIAIHAINFLPWLTGLKFVKVVAARAWNARLKEVPHFQDAAQCMLVMENGCGVLGDVSYLIPDSFNYQHPLYWHLIFWGSNGVLQYTNKSITLWKNGEKEGRSIQPYPSSGNSLNSFLNDIRGVNMASELNTEEILFSTKQTLLIQDAADNDKTNVSLI